MSDAIPKSKPRAPQGKLRNLTYDAREKLHAWFREEKGTITLVEIARRLESNFDIKVSQSTLSYYFSKNGAEIWAKPGTTREECNDRTIVIRIDVPAGCRVDVSTENKGSERK